MPDDCTDGSDCCSVQVIGQDDGVTTERCVRCGTVRSFDDETGLPVA